ncbi:hypothetical protein FNI11_00395 [Salmonella enterica subsp. salamae]|nr:hypothetical protein [Salmonella enterica subsp. salamae]ECJ2279394.1 hypothetical protein [Salmonella enterica subsp. salamae]
MRSFAERSEQGCIRVTEEKDKEHKTTTILHFAGLSGCFMTLINDILRIVNSKIVDKYNIPLN